MQASADFSAMYWQRTHRLFFPQSVSHTSTAKAGTVCAANTTVSYSALKVLEVTRNLQQKWKTLQTFLSRKEREAAKLITMHLFR